MTSGRTEDALFKSRLKREAGSMIDLRRARREHFCPDLFGEPAWDLLLQLYNGADDGRNAPDIKSMAEILDLSWSVVSRWCDVLRELDLISSTDGANLCLTAQARAAMDALIAKSLTSLNN